MESQYPLQSALGGRGSSGSRPRGYVRRPTASHARPGKPARLRRNQSHPGVGARGRQPVCAPGPLAGPGGARARAGSAPGSHSAPGSGGLVRGGFPVRALWGPHQLRASPRHSPPASDSRPSAKAPLADSTLPTLARNRSTPLLTFSSKLVLWPRNLFFFFLNILSIKASFEIKYIREQNTYKKKTLHPRERPPW